jgi:cytidylate kinase
MTAPVLIGIVGPCASGKSTLIAGLQAHGFHARHIAQEHSGVPEMWRKITNPDVLIYLHVSYPVSLQRRQQTLSEAEYQEQVHRLRHARQFADLLIETDELSASEVLQKVLSHLQGTQYQRTGV